MIETLSDKLLREAEQAEKNADQFRGCSFIGEWPGSGFLRQASLLRQAAVIAKRDELRAMKRRARRVAR